MNDRDSAANTVRPLIGKEIGVSNWIEVDQTRIDRFAEVTLDDQWIHLDPERVKDETPFDGPIAHGFLTLSLASRFFYDVVPDLPGAVMGINYGFDKLRFLAPVVSGSKVRGRFVLADLQSKGKTDLVLAHDMTVEIEGETTPALVARWLNLSRFAEPDAVKRE